MTRTAFAILTASLLIASASPLRAADSLVTHAAISPTRIPPGGAFKVTASVHDDDGLMGGFLLNLSNNEMPFEKNIEYLWSDLAGKKDAKIECIVGPGENSRYHDANVTHEWFSGSTTRVRLIVRDSSDNRTTVDVGEISVAADAPATPETETTVMGNAASPSGVGWRADFDDGALAGGTDPVYIIRRTATAAPDRLQYDVKDGILNLAGDFDKEGVDTGDYVGIRWPEIGAPSISDFPILEIRYACTKNAGILIMPVYQFEDGSTQQPYVSYGGDGLDNWNVQTFRLAGDSSLPKEHTPRKLLSVILWLMGNAPGKVQARIDYLSLRPFNPEEQALEDFWVDVMTDYAPPRPPVLRDFFPFGLYADSHNTSSKHLTGQRLPLVRIARAGLNCLLAPSLLGPPDYAGGVAPPYTGAVNPIVPHLEATGMRAMLRVRTGIDTMPLGPDQAQSWTGAILAEAGSSPAVLGYNFKDEPGVNYLWSLTGAKRLLETADPSRPIIINLNNRFVAGAFGPYSTVICTDRYPLSQGGSQKPEELFDWCRDVARDNNNTRQWIIIQSFGKAPWRSHGGYSVPTPAQLRLQTYAALAGGARGIIFYSFSYDRYRMLVDQWLNPNELFAEVTSLARDLIPVCHRLLDSEVEFDARAQSDNGSVRVGVLLDPVRGVRYLIPFNTDIRDPQKTRLSLPPWWFLGERRVYDLHALEPVRSESAAFDVAPIDPGAGRVYLVAAPADFDADRRAILAKRVEEILRRQIPDLSIAKAYAADVAPVEKARADALAALAAGDLDEAQSKAEDARRALDSLLAALSPYTEIARVLNASAQRMGPVEPAMYDDNPKTKNALVGLREPYWALHPRWAECWERALTGDHQGLLKHVQSLDADAQAIVDSIHERIGDGPLY